MGLFEAANDPNAYRKVNQSDYYKCGSLRRQFFEIVDNKFSDDDYRLIFASVSAEIVVRRTRIWTWVRYTLA